MRFDIFLSICQTQVDGFLPTEKQMFQSFFDQVRLADELGFQTAWVAETHLSCEIQKQGENPVIPHFVGEIGLNTDILQMAHKVFSQTKNIHVGSAIRNILCNGGPIAHAEAIRTFLALHGFDEKEKRKLHIGFASGRFDFSNRPYGIVPRDAVEKAAWPAVKGKILRQATEIFLRAIRGDIFSSQDIQSAVLKKTDFRDAQDWMSAKSAYAEKESLSLSDLETLSEIKLRDFWTFEKLGVIPRDVRLDLLELVIGTHDPDVQVFANQFMPTGVFNLSITPPKVIEETHERMRKSYQGSWTRDLMPRTAMVFLDDGPGTAEEKTKRAKEQAVKAWGTYWKAMEGTIDNKKVEQAVDNTLAGNPEQLANLMKDKYHPEDRLMLWFDFNNHNNDQVKSAMVTFMKKVAPILRGST